ncbi:hemolysin secretion protein D [Rhizobium sp. Root149]|uniref:efflux RND transporter periplasmic adaptor subunit n=1 Tax=Rhizobium sp. Root149 TaxID=1736473 RepID=UPI00071255A8|nr:efflux RND transporter periplasmic adaptor subunit [Rhizobium sp. Root149]KQZ49962.1 hemolysin secretion protein D [Rhizobium sp. Root149]
MSVVGLGKLGVAIVAVAAILSGCTEEKKAAEQVIRPVKVVEVKARQAGPLLQYSGSIRARTEVPLGFRVDGKISDRLVDVGQRVKAGQPVARIDVTDYELSVRQAEAELASAEKQVEISQLALKRAETLQSQNITSQSSLEQAQLASRQAIAQRDAAQSSLTQAKNRVGYGVLSSDVDGIVTAVNAEAGQVVAAGTPVIRVAQDGAKEIEVAVPEAEIRQFSPGKSVKTSFWADGNLALEGKVREVAGSADQQSRTFTVRVSLPDNPALRLGMTATISTEVSGSAPGFVLPLAALAKQDGKSIVWLVDPASSKVQPHPVQVDGFAEDGVRIADGLKAGDLVVAAGTQFMQPDLQVKIYEGEGQTAGGASTAVAPSKS